MKELNLVTREVYSDDDEGDDSDEDVAAIAIASSSSPSTSLFDSPNENVTNHDSKCLMAKATEDFASGGIKWVLDSGATSHMTESKSLMMELRPNRDGHTVTYGDKSKSKVLDLGKVVVTPDVSLVNVLLVETLGYNLMSVAALADMGFGTYFDKGIVVLMWSRSEERRVGKECRL